MAEMHPASPQNAPHPQPVHPQPQPPRPQPQAPHPQPQVPQRPAGAAPVAPRPAVPGGPPKIAVIPIQTPKPVDLDPISLVDETPDTAGAPSKIHAFSSSTSAAGSSHSWKRQPNVTGHGAIRVRTFHGRLSDEGMAFIDDKINEWMDQHPDYEIKFVTTNIGTFEGKIREPALIINVWY